MGIPARSIFWSFWVLGFFLVVLRVYEHTEGILSLIFAVTGWSLFGLLGWFAFGSPVAEHEGSHDKQKAHEDCLDTIEKEEVKCQNPQ